MIRFYFLLGLFLVLQFSGISGAKGMSDEDVIDKIKNQVNADRIGEFIKQMTLHPRNTGSDWIKEKQDDLKKIFKDFGMDVITKKYKVLQCFPKEVNASLTEVLDDKGVVVDLYREDGDPEKKILPAFNAWSKSGTVTGKPVYVNYGRKEDFEYLNNTLKLNLTATIGIARYGKLYRGDKAKFAKKYGLAGLIIYMDGQDYSPEGVDPMPDGAGLPELGIQRGTLKDGLGDPSTYLYPSTRYAYHEGPEVYKKILPGIIVMPINFVSALPLLQNLAGAEVHADWQGGYNDTPKYKYGPGFAANSNKDKLRISVNLEYKLNEIEDVFGVIKGKQEPDRWVMIGNHRDTWVQGAVDATTGLATLNEIGHGLSEVIKTGWRPRRTIVLASWGAEEQGIIGSVEFVEDYITLLQEKLVAYINVDVAASGQQNFKPAATPNFKGLLDEAVKSVQAPLNEKYTTLYDQWQQESTGGTTVEPDLKILGSGSDYAGFIHMAGVSSIDLTIVGSYYTYHTEYDNYLYISKYADPQFKGNKAVAQTAAIVLLKLGTAQIVPLSAVEYSTYVKQKLAEADGLRAELKGQNIDIGILDKAIEKFAENAEKYDNRKQAFEKSRRHLDVRRFNDKMLLMERSFLYPPGLPERPQNRHVLFAPSILNSYLGSIFPGIFDCVSLAKATGEESHWNEVRKQVTIATWVTKAAARALSDTVFPN